MRAAGGPAGIRTLFEFEGVPVRVARDERGDAAFFVADICRAIAAEDFFETIRHKVPDDGVIDPETALLLVFQTGEVTPGSVRHRFLGWLEKTFAVDWPEVTRRADAIASEWIREQAN